MVFASLIEYAAVMYVNKKNKDRRAAMQKQQQRPSPTSVVTPQLLSQQAWPLLETRNEVETRAVNKQKNMSEIE